MVGGERSVPATLPPVVTRYPLCRRVGGPQDLGNLAPLLDSIPGPSSPQRAAIPTELSGAQQ
jgi:hypothetical protein